MAIEDGDLLKVEKSGAAGGEKRRITMLGLRTWIESWVSSVSVTLDITKEPLYEYRDLWGEENGGVASNQSEYSFGNGATGSIGIPFGDGWELVEIGFNAENFASTATGTFAVVDFRNAAHSTIATISVSNSDGVGSKVYKVQELSSPVSISSGTVVGFRSITVSGSITDVRISARFRRQIGEYVSDVSVL